MARVCFLKNQKTEERKHTVVIPQAIAREVINATQEIERDEKVMIGLCKSDTFSISELDKLISPEY